MQILTLALQSLKGLHSNGLLLTKVVNVWRFSTLESDANPEKNLTCGFENNMTNLASFHQSTWKSQKFRLLWTVFDQSIYCFSLESTDELQFIALKINQIFEKLHEEFGKFLFTVWKTAILFYKVKIQCNQIIQMQCEKFIISLK